MARKTCLSLGLLRLLTRLKQRKFTLLNTAERHTVWWTVPPSPRRVSPTGVLTIGILPRKSPIPLPVAKQLPAACRRFRQFVSVLIPRETDTPPLPRTIRRPLSPLTPPTFLQITLLANVLLLTTVIIRFGLFPSPPVYVTLTVIERVAPLRLVTKVLRVSLPGPGKFERLLSPCKALKCRHCLARSPRAQYRRFMLNMKEL